MERAQSLTPDEMVALMATPSEERVRYGSDVEILKHQFDQDGYTLEYHPSWLSADGMKEWREKGYNYEPKDAWGYWTIEIPLDTKRKAFGSETIGVADDKSNHKSVGGLSFEQALAAARVRAEELKELPRRTIVDVGHDYLEELAGSGMPLAEWLGISHDLGYCMGVWGIRYHYIWALDYLSVDRMQMARRVVGKRTWATSGPERVTDEERAQAYTVTNRIIGHFIAMCEYGYKAGDTGLRNTWAWRKLKTPLLAPEQRAERQKLARERQRQRDAELQTQVEKYRERQRLHNEAKVLGIITDKKSKPALAKNSKPMAYTVQTAAEALGGVPVETVQNWVGSGRLASVNVDGVVLIPAAALSALLKGGA